MESFYSGRQGYSVNIVAHYTDTLNAENKIIRTAVQNMMDVFAQGAITTSDVGYGEYVLVNTSYRKDENNGNLYRRGFGYGEPAIYRIRQEIIIKTDWPKDVVEIIQRRENSSGKEFFIYSDNKYICYDPEGLSKINFTESFFNAIVANDETRRDVNKFSHLFYLYSGHGAEYIGRIIGPIGETPTVGLDHYENIAKRPEGADGITYNVDPDKDLYPGGPSAEENEIKINWVNVEDVNGNVEGWLVGFKMPYLNPVFYTSLRSPYYTESVYHDGTELLHSKGDILEEGYTELIQERYSKDEEGNNIKYPFYREWNIEIPKGIKGDSLDSFFIDDNDELFANIRSYEKKEQGELINPPTSVGTLNLIKDLIIAEGSSELGTTSEYVGHLLVKYSAKEGPITYNGIEGYFDLGLAKGKDAGNLCLYTRLPFEDDAAVDTFVSTLNGLADKIVPENIYRIYYNSSANLTTSSAAQSSNWTRTLSASEISNLRINFAAGGWGLLLTIQNQDSTIKAYSCIYDYALDKWVINLLTNGVGYDPGTVLTNNELEIGQLIKGGYHFDSQTITIKSVYNCAAFPAEYKDLIFED